MMACNQICGKIAQLRQDIEHNPQKYLSNTPDGVQAFASQPPDPHWKASLILFSLAVARFDWWLLCKRYLLS